MKKIINAPADYVNEMLTGLSAAHPALERVDGEPRAMRHTDAPVSGKVGVVTGGGSGHLPLFTGYIGKGLLDACAIGGVFEGPTVDSCIAAIKAADSGKGVLCLYGNYGGDRMNFDLACEFLDGEIRTATVLGTDDIASAEPTERHKRRGVAGIVYAFKVAGAAASSGTALDEVAAIAGRTVDRTRSIGVALTGCRIPGSAAASFSIGPDEIEFGMGIHGEPGIWRDKLKPADALADEMVDRILEEKPDDSGDRVSVLVNGLGATPLEELFILYRRVDQRLRDAGFTIVRPLVGPFVTSMEMAGASLSICFLDFEIEKALAAPAECPFWRV